MKSPIVILSVTIVVLAITYLAYDLLKTRQNPCESLFEQTTTNLQGNLEIIKQKGSIRIGNEKTQELTAKAQNIALVLKTCCLLRENNKLSSDDFLRCKDLSEKSEKQVTEISSCINKDKVDQACIKKVDSQIELITKYMDLLIQMIPFLLSP